MILNLGIIDNPYADKNSISTVQVAKILEGKYGVMRAFYDLHQKDIVKSLENSVVNALNDVLNGAPVTTSVFSAGEQEIEELFKFQFLEQAEVERLGIKGVPTMASIQRRSLRFKKKVGPNKRPSFIDTGLYEQSFKVWVEE